MPSEYYTDDTIFKKIKGRMMEEWHFSIHKNEISNNNIIPMKNSLEIMGESIVLVKDDDIRAMSNVCTHRGMILNTENNNSKNMKCKYHGRSFTLKGCILNMPEFKEVLDFPSEMDNLINFPVHMWKGLLFISRIEKELPRWLIELEDRLSWMPIESFRYDNSYYRSYDIKSNWALYVDNYLEGFHIPYVHSDLNKILDYNNYETELFEGGVLQIGIAKKGESIFNLPPESKDYGKNIAAYYYWLFPGIMMNFYPWGLSVNFVIPMSIDSTKIVYKRYIWDEELIGKGAGGDLDKVEKEDQDIVEAVQRGVSSKSYTRGRYSPTMEKGIHHFHRILTNSF